MYAVKGSWVGQTFALATASDSSGKKSRVRRSKEERKSMVETFIKRHQGSNNGSFPSLNLTHKEVGGSFYTVREIVREIIQENRVLGPAQYPLGSNASEPQASFFHSRIEQNDVFDDVSNQLEEKIMELGLDNEEHYINDQDMNSFQSASEDEIDKIGENLDDQACTKLDSKDVAFSKHVVFEKTDKLESEDISGSSEVLLDSSRLSLDENETITAAFTDGIRINGVINETDKLQAAGPLASDRVETNGKLSVIGERKGQIILPTEEIVVETFPLKQENNDNDDLGRASIDSGNSNGIWSDIEVKPVDLTNGRPLMDKISSRVNSNTQETEKGTNGSQLSNYVHVNGEVVESTDCNQINEASEFTKSPEIKEDSVVPHDQIEQLSSPNAVLSKTVERHDHQSNNAPKGPTSLDGRSGNSNKEPPFLVVSGNNNRRDDKAVGKSSPPVDRINLQSWEKAVLKQQPNPLLAIFKAFADALIKFWS